MTNNSQPANTFDYKGWLVDIDVTGEGEIFAGRADLFLNGDHKCRVVLVTGRSEYEAAGQALKAKTRVFIDEWIARPRAGPADPGGP